MIITAQVDGWTYLAQPLSTPAADFGRFASAVAMWRAKAPAGMLPRKRDFQPEDFRGWLGWVIIYEVVPEPFDLRFRLFGSNLAENLNTENTGKLFSQAYAHVPGHTVTLRHFRTLWRQRMIGMSSGPMNWEGLAFHSGLFLDLPVADDTGKLAYFFTFSRLGDESLTAEMPIPRRPVAVLATAH
jgi:hypothetical protein